MQTAASRPLRPSPPASEGDLSLFLSPFQLNELITRRLTFARLFHYTQNCCTNELTMSFVSYAELAQNYKYQH